MISADCSRQEVFNGFVRIRDAPSCSIPKGEGPLFTFALDIKRAGESRDGYVLKRYPNSSPIG